MTCADGIWKAEYFANTTFTSAVMMTNCDSGINENYKGGDPAEATLPANDFGVRWITKRNSGSEGPSARYRLLRLMAGLGTWTEVAIPTGASFTDYVPGRLA
jgi:hypothetical protein